MLWGQEVLARHASPDETLTLVVLRQTPPEGDPVLSLGFMEFDWHVHPEFFFANERTPERVLLDIVDDVINDRMILIYQRFADGLMHPRILDSLEFEVDFYQPGEEWTFRFWSGRVVDLDDLLDGRVRYKPLGGDALDGYVGPPRRA